MTSDHRKNHIPKGRLVFYGFLAIAGVLLFTEHRAHVLGALPFLLLLSCPLMHLFMHHNHGTHNETNPNDAAPKGDNK